MVAEPPLDHVTPHERPDAQEQRDPQPVTEHFNAVRGVPVVDRVYRVIPGRMMRVTGRRRPFGTGRRRVVVVFVMCRHRRIHRVLHTPHAHSRVRRSDQD